MPHPGRSTPRKKPKHPINRKMGEKNHLPTQRLICSESLYRLSYLLQANLTYSDVTDGQTEEGIRLWSFWSSLVERLGGNCCLKHTMKMEVVYLFETLVAIHKRIM
jgi:hypothetical protein